MQIAALAQRDQLVDDALKLFRFRQGRLDLFMNDQGRRHVGEHCFAVLMCPVELPVSVSVTHWSSP